MVCTILYLTYRTGVECNWKAKTSCKRHFVLHGSIPCQGQKFFNSSKASRRDLCPSLPPTKGVSEAASLGNRTAAVRSEQLTTLMLMLRTSEDILPLPQISRVQISPKLRRHLKTVLQQLPTVLMLFKEA